MLKSFLPIQKTLQVLKILYYFAKKKAKNEKTEMHTIVKGDFTLNNLYFVCDIVGGVMFI